MTNVKEAVSYDTTSQRRECMFRMPALLHRVTDPHLSDKRDAIMLDLLFNITVILLPSTALQFFRPASWQPYSIYLGICHLFIIYFFFIQRFILMLHYSEHKRVFKAQSPFTFIHGYAPYVLCPLFGIPAGCYRLHHVVMHHLEDNIFPWDLSSTMPYQRDNLLHFFHYWGRFVFAIHFELPYYAFKRNRMQMAVGCFVAEAIWFTSMYVLGRINFTAALFTLILPFVITSFALMFGNWSQHIFVDPDRPEVDYHLTYNCINHIENLYTFNDGYHIVHHINSVLHWSEMPNRFLRDLQIYSDQGAIIFSDLHFMQVGLYTMTGQWSNLYKHVVHLSDTPKSEQEVVTDLKRRLKPCTSQKVKGG